MTDHRPEVRECLKEVHEAYFRVLPFLSSWQGQGANIAIEAGSNLEKAIRKAIATLAAPPIEPVGTREALERCLTEMKKTAISIRKEAGYKAVHCDFIGAIEQACVALAATPVPVVEEVVTVLTVRDHNWGCGFDAEDMPGKIKLCAYSTTKVNEGDRIRVVVYREEAE